MPSDRTGCLRRSGRQVVRRPATWHADERRWALHHCWLVRRVPSARSVRMTPKNLAQIFDGKKEAFASGREGSVCMRILRQQLLNQFNDPSADTFLRDQTGFLLQ